tara:strand:+ start:8099 stop:8731 length:633 start_codon:yes stop_codon:yes gene_type:complete
MQYCLAIVGLITAVAFAATNSSPINDSFTDAANWDMNPMWKLTDAGKMMGTSKVRSILELKNKIQTKDVTFEAQITPLEAQTQGWKTCGIGIYTDNKNYWALNLVERPDESNKTHFVELKEMKDGKWGIDEKHNKVILHKSGFDWQYNTTYSMKLTLNATHIIGSVADEAGKEVASFKVQFIGDTPPAGSPILRITSIQCEYDNAVIDWK